MNKELELTLNPRGQAWEVREGEMSRYPWSIDPNLLQPPPPPTLNLTPAAAPPRPFGSSSSSFLDLTLATTTSSHSFLTPKLEPLGDHHHSPLPDPNHLLPLNPNSNNHHRNLHLVPKPEPPPPEPIDVDADDDLPLSSASSEDLFSALLTLQLHLKRRRPQPASSDPLALAVVLPPPPPLPHPKPPPRSSELVRISPSGPRDREHLRNSLRRTRATYESLRTILSECSLRRTPSPSSSRRSRADLDAAMIMSRHGLWINRDKRIVGSIPGILVGDIFFFRMELCVVGLHGQVQAGIDYLSPTRSPNREPIATSIVVSGGYEDDEDTGDVIFYTGHGGRSSAGGQAVDQKLEYGNLALERSMFHNLEIRVIRGFRYDGSPSGKVYVYDGLYRVVHFWRQPGKSGFSVLKYKLLRLSDQDEMGTSVMRRAEDIKEQLRRSPSSLPPGYLHSDISQGKENLPVALFNDLDSDRHPLEFDYLRHPIYFNAAPGSGGCRCTGPCEESTCSCAEKNGGGFAYDSNGFLLMGKPLIYECGNGCGCPATCRNRVTQKGLRNRLEVFRSEQTGWGVRSLDLIRAGSFVCEYSGVILNREESKLMTMNGDGLVHPNRFPNRWYEWGDVSGILPENPRPVYPTLPRPVDFSIDVSTVRNVACYLSQSCSPNIFLQLVLFDDSDASYPHLMIFAMENIPPLRELSIDYGVEDEALAHANSPG